MRPSPHAAFAVAVQLFSAGRLQESDAEARKALATSPGDQQVLRLLAAIAYQRADFAGSARILQQLAKRSPTDAMLQNDLGAALEKIGKNSLAAAAYQAAVRHAPGLAVAWRNLGNVQSALGRWSDAVASYQNAQHHGLADRALFHNMALAHEACGQTDRAEQAYRAALSHGPVGPATVSAFATFLMGRALAFDRADTDKQADNAEAARLLTELAKFVPTDASVQVRLGDLALGRGAPHQAFNHYRQALAINADDMTCWKAMLSTALHLNHLTLAELEALHRQYGQRLQDLAGRNPPKARRPRKAGTKLRIGYLSSDFRQHSVARNMLPIISAHDRDRFSIHCYADIARPDEMTRRFRELADGWRDIHGKSDKETAEIIASDGLDILVCLAAHFDANRPSVLAWRPAPVQVSLHDVATTGLSTVDYLLADPVLAPRRGPEFFAERVFRLPTFYHANFPADASAPNERLGQAPPVFGFFGNPAKISPESLMAWGRILAALPDARMVFKYYDRFADQDLGRSIRQAIESAGASAEQVMLVTQSQTTADHLQHYDGIDIALDSFPFCGSTTTFEALVMGKPMVTLASDRMIGRWSASMLKALGLTDLVAVTVEDYVRIAVQAGHSVANWRTRAGEIRETLRTSSLCRPDLRTRQIERFYRAVASRQ
ncbi:hypothetical protein A6A05_04170 [Magnetospirillum moscoviense]|uniref:protein O-GlcNAc transferase n=1 Tax=Magnetospirillum moscoviense TaxID=1437059 RepID=A0A178MEV8_9PROT|nr:hypothetical protein A6A05_04170 [Magnetospirillum moscoviense]